MIAESIIPDWFPKLSYQINLYNLITEDN